MIEQHISLWRTASGYDYAEDAQMNAAARGNAALMAAVADASHAKDRVAFGDFEETAATREMMREQLRAVLDGSIDQRFDESDGLVVSDEVVAIVGDVTHWQRSLGELLACKPRYHGRRMMLYLYGDDTKKLIESGTIREICEPLFIEVMKHETDYATLKAEHEQREEARRSRDVAAVSQSMLLERELTVEEELELRPSIHDVRLMRDIATARLHSIMATMRKVPPDDLACSVAILEMYKDAMLLFDRVEAIYAYHAGANKQAKQFIADSLVFQDSGSSASTRTYSLDMCDLDASLRQWCKQQGCESYALIRSNIKQLLARVGVTPVKTRRGYILRGVKLCNTRISPSLAMPSCFGSPSAISSQKPPGVAGQISDMMSAAMKELSSIESIVYGSRAHH